MPNVNNVGVGGSMSAAYQATSAQLVVVYHSNYCGLSHCTVQYGYSVTAAVPSTSIGPLELAFSQPVQVKKRHERCQLVSPYAAHAHSRAAAGGSHSQAALCAALTESPPAVSLPCVYDVPATGQVGLLQLVYGDGYA